jgi:DNA-binding transcriptional ArsR family regulator
MQAGLPNPASADRERTVSGRALRELVELLKQLGDPSRLTILVALAEHGEMSASTLCSLLQQSQPAVSRHLAKLRVVGLVQCRRTARCSLYRIGSVDLANLVERGFNVAAGGPALQGRGFALTFRRRRALASPGEKPADPHAH